MSSESKKERNRKIGELLVEAGLITQVQLKEAMKVQLQSGGKLGSILVELGYIDMDRILAFLGKQHNLPYANLFNVVLEPTVMNALPFQKMKEYGVIPLSLNDKTLILAMASPDNFSAVSNLESSVGKTIKPVIALSSQIAEILGEIEKKGGRLEKPHLTKTIPVKSKEVEIGDLQDSQLLSLLKKLVNDHGSDLLLTAGVSPCIKKGHDVQRLSPKPLTPEQVRRYAYELMNNSQREEFERSKELDTAYTFPDIGRFRVNIYQQRNSISIAARHIVERIPTIEELGVPAWIEEFALKPQGLVLITGPTGHGKTTTLASMIDIINTKRRCNIISIEDPIEFLHKHKASNINQREVGVDTDSFHDGLRHIFRQAPDVIVIGEMRDMESFSIALQAAETGHLVLSTLHSNNATSTVDRIVDIFPPHQQPQIRVQLAENLVLVLSQRLVASRDGKKRVLAYERLTNSYRIRNFIREGKTYQIRTMLQQTTDDYMSIDQTLARLCLEGKISNDTGLKYSDNQTFYTDLVNRGGGPGKGMSKK